MPALSITIDLSGLEGIRAAFAEFDRTFITWLQVGAIEIILPALKREIPVRTGTLRDARDFYPTGRGGAFVWEDSGFYWRFQEGLSERQIEIVRAYIPVVSRFARDRTLAELGL